MECAYSVSERFRKDFSLTPYSLTVGMIISEQCRSQFDPCGEQRLFIPKTQKKNSMFLFLKLINCAETPYKDLLAACSKVLHPTVYGGAVCEVDRVRLEGMDAILLKVKDMESLFSDSDELFTNFVHKTSVVGKFLRKLTLAISTLDFTSQTQFAKRLAKYVQDGVVEPIELEHARNTTFRDVSIILDDVTGDGEVGDDVEGTSTRNKTSTANRLKSDEFRFYDKDKARAFLRRQGQKLRDDPVSALPPRELHAEIMRILKTSPDLAEAHYLLYMNELMFSEYTSAVENCHKHFLLRRDIHEKKFRFALLNLAMIHRKFGHLKQAEMALKECIDLSQHAYDKDCLQHALAWLCRTDQDVMSGYIKTSIVQSWQQQLWSLYSLGLQTLSKLGAMSGRTPSSCFESLVGKNLKHLDSAAVQVNYIISKAILWIGYGYHMNSKLHCEAILHLGHTKITSLHRDWIVSNESTILAFIFMSRYSVQDYDYPKADEYLEIATALVPGYTDFKHLLELARLCNECEKALHKEDYDGCEALIDSLGLLSMSDAQLYKVRMFHQMGNSEQAIKLLDLFQKDLEYAGSYGNLVKWLLQSRMLIDANGDNAIQIILKGLAVCDRFHLQYLHAMFKLELVRAQCRGEGYTKDLIRSSVDAITPMILAHGSKEDILWLRLETTDVFDTSDAITALRKCFEDSVELGDQYKARRALNFISRLYDKLGDVRSRNAYAKMTREFTLERGLRQIEDFTRVLL